MIKKASLALSLLVVLALFLRLAFFAVSVTHLPVSSDESLTVLEAKEISHGRLPLLFWTVPFSFPVESYLMAPVVRLMPRTPFGARWLALTLGLISAGLSLVLYRLVYPKSWAWPGALLILFPSAYLLIFQSAYALPFYGSAMVYWALASSLAMLSRRDGPRAGLALCGSAFCAGLALSSYMLSVPMVAAVMLFLLLPPSPRQTLRNAALALPSFIIGLVPFLIVTWRNAGAGKSVTGSVPLAAALRRFWSRAISDVWPAAMGIDPPLFTDFPHKLFNYPPARTLFGLLFLLTIILATALAAGDFIRDLWRKKWPSLRPEALFIGASWLCLAAFLLSSRSSDTTYRYLLLAVWCFPFVIGSLLSRPGRILPLAFGGFALLLACWNVLAGVGLMGRWTEKNFSLREASLLDLQPAVGLLRERNIATCYAPFSLAYRVDFLTDEQIVCAEPYNDRHPGWPLPYQEEVDSRPGAAYLLSPKSHHLRSPREFEGDLRQLNAAFEKETAGEIVVYHSFRDGWPEGSRLTPGKDFEVRVNGAVVPALTDGRADTLWTSSHPQQEGMRIEIVLKRPERIEALSLAYGADTNGLAPYLDLSAREKDGWRALLKNQRADTTGFEMRNGHPVADNARSVLRFEPTLTDALRLEIARPRKERPWSLAEIELYR